MPEPPVPALSDPYVSEAEYIARSTGGQALRDDDPIADDLQAASRLFDLEMGIHPGALHPHEATYVFDGHGGTLLDLRDGRGLGYFLRGVAEGGIGVDSGSDGSFAGLAFDLDVPWLRGVPENAAAFDRPFTGLELLPHIRGGLLREWRRQPALVAVAGDWGFEEVPEIAKAVVTSMTRELRDHFGAGAVGRYQQYDADMPLSDQTWRLIASAKRQREINRRLPAFA